MGKDGEKVRVMGVKKREEIRLGKGTMVKGGEKIAGSRVG